MYRRTRLAFRRTLGRKPEYRRILRRKSPLWPQSRRFAARAPCCGRPTSAWATATDSRPAIAEAIMETVGLSAWRGWPLEYGPGTMYSWSLLFSYLPHFLATAAIGQEKMGKAATTMSTWCPGRTPNRSKGVGKLPGVDSNHERGNQNPLCYHYTTG